MLGSVVIFRSHTGSASKRVWETLPGGYPLLHILNLVQLTMTIWRIRYVGVTLAVFTVGSKNDVWQSDVEDYATSVTVKFL
jgi:hypothetical protein